jgi:hypothetical protein
MYPKAVVRQEMLHMALSGNILCAIGGTPKVYGQDYMPTYPSEIFYDEIQMNLAPATKHNINTFVEVSTALQTVYLLGLIVSFRSKGQVGC